MSDVSTTLALFSHLHLRVTTASLCVLSRYAIYRRRAELWRARKHGLHSLLVSLGWEDDSMREMREQVERKERQALARRGWVNHGLPIEEFNFEKMLDIWRADVKV